ncbi:MAG: glycerate kinase [Thermoanaerobaculia bacterium]
MQPRDLLTELYRAAVASVEPGWLVGDALGRRGDALRVRSVLSSGQREFVFVPSRVALLAVGKAAVPMARAAHAALGGRVDEALVVAPSYETGEGLPPGSRLILAGHPVPDEGSLEAGTAALALAGRLGPGDLLLVLLSGGGSSLMAAPVEGLSLADKSRAISLLMAAGAPIAEMNAVRGALSRVKAGWLSAACGPAEVVSLVLSDLGDDGWHLVASGPTLGIPPSPANALAILERYRVTTLVPPSVRAVLALPAPPPSLRQTGPRWSVLLADIRTALEGARLAALRLGMEARIVPELLRGEARSAARRLAVAGASAGHHWRRTGGRPHVSLFGGETTVTVKGHGHGGRNRELALATAIQLAGTPGAAALVAGTDGIDHESDAAGAFVDGTTVSRAEAAGLDPWKALRDNDTGPFFAALGDAFSPGATGTNVGDIAFVWAVGPDAGTPAD